MSELEEIRTALNLNQKEFGGLLGAKAQSTYQRWETSPTSAASREALERAKKVYQERKGKPWSNSKGSIDGPSILEERMPRYSPQDLIQVTGVLPEHIIEAWMITHEAAQKGATDLMAVEDQAEVGEVIATIAVGVRQGGSHEGRMRLIRTAERLLMTIGKLPR